MTTAPPRVARPQGQLRPQEVIADLATRLAELLRTSDGRPLVGLDVASLSDPHEPGRVRLEAPGRPTYTLRTVSGAILLARTPGADAPCSTCFDQRWLACRSEQDRHLYEEPHGVLLSTTLPFSQQVVSVLAALITSDIAAPESAIVPVWQLTVPTFAISRWALMKDSACPQCGTPAPDTPDGARIELTPTPVARVGASRQGAPEALGLPLDALANPVCGALGPLSMRAYHATASAPTSGQFLVRSKYGLHQMWWSGHAESYARSELLGMLEGLERAAGQRPSAKLPGPWAARWEVNSPAVEFETCGLYSDAFYAKHTSKYARWDKHPQIPWAWGWSLRDQRAIAVPEQLAYYLDHRVDHKNTVQECSNGCASGASVVEATVHGLLELIERDAFLTSWYAPLTPPEIDLDSLDAPLVQHMREQVDQLGYDLRCFDTRTDIPVPAVGAVAVRRDGGPGRLCFAGGAGLEPVDAIMAAVCEVASYVPGFSERVLDRRELLALAVTDFSFVTELEHHALLYGMPELADFADHWLTQERRTPIDEVFADWQWVHRPSDDLAVTARHLVTLLAERGFDTIVVDQTSPEQKSLGVHTVATIVPGMVPIDFGWERQRCLGMPRTYAAHYHAGKAPRPFTGGELIAAPHPFP